MDLMILGFRPVSIYQALVAVGVIELSAVDHPILNDRCTRSRVVVIETVNKLVVVCFCCQFIVRSPEFVTMLRRPVRPLKIGKSTVHDNRVSLKHTSRKFTSAFTDHL